MPVSTPDLRAPPPPTTYRTGRTPWAGNAASSLEAELAATETVAGTSALVARPPVCEAALLAMRQPAPRLPPAASIDGPSKPLAPPAAAAAAAAAAVAAGAAAVPTVATVAVRLAPSVAAAAVVVAGEARLVAVAAAHHPHGFDKLKTRIICATAYVHAKEGARPLPAILLEHHFGPSPSDLATTCRNKRTHCNLKSYHLLNKEMGDLLARRTWVVVGVCKAGQGPLRSLSPLVPLAAR